MKPHLQNDNGCDTKEGQSFLSGLESKFRTWAVPIVPCYIETYHLTLLTLLWAAGVLFFGYLSKENLVWLHGVSIMIVLQYITDVLDGAVGRYRQTGLIKWGFYMDHFLDYIFNGTLVIAGCMISPPGLSFWFMALLLLLSAFMVSSFLEFGATLKFKIYFLGVGPTEIRIFFILINFGIIYFGTDYFSLLLPIICLICGFSLGILVYHTQNNLWQHDMQIKHEKESL